MIYDEERRLMVHEHGFAPNTSEPEVSEFLYALCAMVKAKKVIEVGVWRGYTSTWLAEAVGFDNLTLVDIEDNLSMFFPDEGRKRFIKGKSVDVIPKLKEKFDLAYLDADHQYESTLMELDALRPKMNCGGIICCHDAIASPGVGKAAMELFPNGFVLVTPKILGLAILRV